LRRPWVGELTFALVLAGAAAGCGDTTLHPFFTDGPAARRPLVIAHRGGGGLQPEATLPAMMSVASKDPLAVIEFDVHRSRDGHLVVIHDGTVDRTTNGKGAVAEMDLAQLKALDAGYCASPGRGDGTMGGSACRDSSDTFVFPFRGKGYQIPTLAEVFAALPAEAFLSIEVKGAGFEPQFVEAVRASGRSLTRFAVGSEEDDISVRLKDLLPEAAHYHPKGAGTCLALTGKLHLGYPCPEYDAFASPLTGAGLHLDTRAVIDAAHDQGAVVLYWTINDGAIMDRLLRLGADGLVTDYPDTARAVAERLRDEGVFK
jgi:glycerophosphoryl diester phosphodiesterase